MKQEDIQKLQPGTPLRHRFIGPCTFTGACAFLMVTHCDPTSMYVQEDESKDIIEVSTHLVDVVNVSQPEEVLVGQ